MHTSHPPSEVDCSIAIRLHCRLASQSIHRLDGLFLNQNRLNGITIIFSLFDLGLQIYAARHDY